MRTFGIILIVLASFVLALDITFGVYGNYQVNRDVFSYWSLADKASTIPQKSEYIDKFVSALESKGYEGTYNAIIFTTPDNSFDRNLEALKSLQLRLHEVETMDVTSFQYQTAIQQITAQEQGEAHAMLCVFKGIWWKNNYFFLWDWICSVQVLLMVIIIITGAVVAAENNDRY
jgi:hypothetical protein